MPLMKPADLEADLRITLGDQLNRINDADATRRFLRVAVADMHRVRPRLETTPIVLSVGVDRYAMPDDALMFHGSSWARQYLSIPAYNRAGERPPTGYIDTAGAARWLQLRHAPTPCLIQMLGAAHSVHYFAQHVLAEDSTSIKHEDRELLLLRAQAEAMKEIALNNAGKPGSSAYRGGDASVPRNSTASSVYQALMAEFERA